MLASELVHLATSKQTKFVKEEVDNYCEKIYPLLQYTIEKYGDSNMLFESSFGNNKQIKEGVINRLQSEGFEVYVNRYYGLVIYWSKSSTYLQRFLRWIDAKTISNGYSL